FGGTGADERDDRFADGGSFGLDRIRPTSPSTRGSRWRGFSDTAGLARLRPRDQALNRTLFPCQKIVSRRAANHKDVDARRPCRGPPIWGRGAGAPLIRDRRNRGF